MKNILFIISLIITIFFAIACEPDNQDAAGLQDNACNTNY